MAKCPSHYDQGDYRGTGEIAQTGIGMARHMGWPFVAGRIDGSQPKSRHSRRKVAPRIDDKNVSADPNYIRISGMVAA
jgi:hypothetical protein